MLSDLRRRQTLKSFDYQWGHMAEGDAMLSDPWFLERVDGILANELLGVDRTWFPGRTALDAGCGSGRWTLGLLRLGCDVTAVDASRAGIEATRDRMRRLCPEARWSRETGLSDVTRTIPHTDLFVRACRDDCSARPFLSPPSPPYWFEHYKRRV